MTSAPVAPIPHAPADTRGADYAPPPGASQRRPRPRSLVALARHRLRRTFGARLGLALAAVAVLVFAALAAVIRSRRGDGSDLDGLVLGAARTVAWLGAGPVALAAAHDRPSDDRRDGIDVLAAARGFPREMLDGARFIASIAQTALVVGIPLLGFWITLVGLAPSAAAIGRRLAQLPALAIFVTAIALTIGGLGALSGYLARNRGRIALGVVLIVPWALAEATGHRAYSLPGALDALLRASLLLMTGQLR